MGGLGAVVLLRPGVLPGVKHVIGTAKTCQRTDEE